MEGNPINEYESICIAGKENNIWAGSISNCCKRKLKSVGGFIWKYSYKHLIEKWKEKYKDIEIIYCDDDDEIDIFCADDDYEIDIFYSDSEDLKFGIEWFSEYLKSIGLNSNLLSNYKIKKQFID